MTTDDVRVGILGYGFGGAIFHAPFVAATPGMRVAAVVTSDPQRQANLRAEHPDAAVLESADALFDRVDELDLIVVTTPNRSHVELTQRALAAGLPVVIDKPMAPSAAEARSLVADAAAKGLMLTVFQNRRYDSDFRTVRRLVDSGELGTVTRFESRYERWVPTPKQGWRMLGAADEAGGLLFDLGAHIIDQALQLFGPATSVYAEIDHRRPGVVVDDDTFVAITHRSGVRSHLWMSQTAAEAGPRFSVLGSGGAFTKFGMDVQEAALIAGRRPPAPDWGIEPESSWGVIGIGDDTRRVPSEPGRYQDFYAGVLASLRDGAPPPVDPADSIAALDVIEAAQRSAATGGPALLGSAG